MKNSVHFLRKAGLVEAISFIVLVGVAMPLKYFWGMPMAVKIVGMIHGILFLIFCAALIQVLRKERWSLGRAAFVFAAALIPVGPFMIDRRMKQWAQDPQ